MLLNTQPQFNRQCKALQGSSRSRGNTTQQPVLKRASCPLPPSGLAHATHNTANQPALVVAPGSKHMTIHHRDVGSAVSALPKRCLAPAEPCLWNVF
jgi:hypothetical protein